MARDEAVESEAVLVVVAGAAQEWASVVERQGRSGRQVLVIVRRKGETRGALDARVRERVLALRNAGCAVEPPLWLLSAA